MGDENVFIVYIPVRMRLSLLWAALAAAVILTGCAGTGTLPNSPSSLSEVNDALTNRTARLYLEGDDSGRNGSLVTLTRDSVYYVDGILSRHPSTPQGDRPMRQVRISAVDSIGMKYNGGGGRLGALIGATPGLISGTSIGFSLLDGCRTESPANACEFGAIMTGIYTFFVAGGGAVLGALIGNAVDDDVRTVYRAPASQYLAPGAESAASSPEASNSTASAPSSDSHRR
jgi:hypothetical protein